MISPETPDRKSSREALRKTVERFSPPTEIDTTKVLSDEEIAEFRRQCEEKAACQELATKLGRDGLRERIKKAAKDSDKAATRYFDPTKLRDELDKNRGGP